MRFLSLILNELRFKLNELKVYWVESIAGILVTTSAYLGLFYGIKSFFPSNLGGENLEGLFFGYVLWTYASPAFVAASGSVSESTEKGFLQQLYLCPQGFTSVVSASVVADLIINTIFTVFLAYLAMWITGNWIDLNFLLLLPLLILSVVSLIGVGLIFGGLTLLFKQVKSFALVSQATIVALVSIPALPFGIASFLPFAPGATLARMTILANEPITLLNLTIVIANSAFYLLLGIFCYKYFEVLAKKRNLVGMY